MTWRENRGRKARTRYSWRWLAGRPSRPRRQCGLTERTIYRRLKDAEFRNRLQDLRTDMVRRAAGMLTAAATSAVNTLLSLQKESVTPSVRLGAARAVLELGIKVRELAELQLRMDELEAMVKQHEQAGSRGSW